MHSCPYKHPVADQLSHGLADCRCLDVAYHQGLQIVPQVCEEALLLVGMEGGLAPDCPVIASQPLLGDVGSLPCIAGKKVHTDDPHRHNLNDASAITAQPKWPQ